MNVTQDPKHDPPIEHVNFNISAYRVLYILLVFIRHRTLTLLRLNELLSGNPLIDKSFSGETLLKYLDTLHQAGCRFRRTSNRSGCTYELEKSPFLLEIEDSEVKIAGRLLQLMSTHPDEDLHVAYHQFLRKLSWALPEGQQELLLPEDAELFSPSESVLQRRALLKRFKRFCRDAQILEIHYRHDDGNVETILLEPIQVCPEKRRILLLGTERQSHKKRNLDLDRVQHVRQLPSKVQNPAKPVPVTFELTGRLARTYRLYPNETLLEESPDRLVVKAHCDDYPTLLNRLMKYNGLCEVLSPRYAREEIQRRIQKLLAHTEEPVPPSTV